MSARNHTPRSCGSKHSATFRKLDLDADYIPTITNNVVAQTNALPADENVTEKPVWGRVKNIAQMTAPVCSGCTNAMQWSNNSDGSYAKGWSCKHFERCQSDTRAAGSYRWFCHVCSDDICSKCANETISAETGLPPCSLR